MRIHTPTILAAPVLLAALAPAPSGQNAGIDWSVHLGGAADESAGHPHGVCALADGGSFIAGATRPATGGSKDVLVARISPAGAVLWSVTFGAGADEQAEAVAYRAATGELFVAGWTASPAFPVTPATAMFAAHAGGRDAFVAQLDPQSGAVRYATFLGGAGDEMGTALHADAAGDVWLHGWTESSNLPTTPQAWSRARLGGRDLFVARFDPSVAGPAALRYSTYFGSPGNEPSSTTSDLHVDPNGVVTMLAETDSSVFPTTPNAWSTTFLGGGTDVVVCRLDPSLPPASQLVASTYFGGSDFENGNDLAVRDGIVWITGQTRSLDLPTDPTAPQPTNAGSTDAYLFALDPGASGSGQILWGTYYGGSAFDGGSGVAIDASGVLTLVGATMSPALPGMTPGSFQSAPPSPTTSSFLARLDPSINRIEYATYFGVAGALTGLLSVDPDPLGGVLCNGIAAAALPHATNPHAGGADLVVARFNLLPLGAERCGVDSPTCGARLFTGVRSWPKSGSAQLALRCSGMPIGGTAPAFGVLLADFTASCGPLAPFLGVSLLLPFHAAVSLPAASGTTVVPLPLGGVPPGAAVSFQFGWVVNPPSCGPAPLSTSNVLRVVVQ